MLTRIFPSKYEIKINRAKEMVMTMKKFLNERDDDVVNDVAKYGWRW